jgi:hypothetical protein
MKKCRFPIVALNNFSEMPIEKLEREISSSLEALSRLKPRNHHEELLLAGNYKRVEVLKVILAYRGQDNFMSKLGEVAVLVDL